MLISAADRGHQNQQTIENTSTEENTPTEETALLIPQSEELIPSKISTPLKDSILIKTAAFGTNGLLMAAHIAFNGKLLTMTGEKGAAAGALASTYLSVILGTGVGILLSTGINIGQPIGQKNYQEAGAIAKSAWALTGLVGGISTAAMLGSRNLFPLLFEKETAQVASDFFTGYAAIGIPMLMLVTNPQIAFQVGDWYVPPVVSLMFFSAGAIGSYLLAFPAKLGALGVGLGGTFAAAVTALISQAWFSRSHYEPYQLYSSSIPGFGEKIKSLLNTGWQLSFQRMTEWGSLMLMTTVIGIYGNNALMASQPAIQYTGLIASAVQSLAQATGMILARNKGAIIQAQIENNKSEAQAWYQKSVSTVNVNNIAAALGMAVMAVGFYIEREPLASFFLPDTVEPEIKSLAETLLWVSMIGMIPDAARITGIGALRSWQDIAFPTLASFLTMIVIGVPLGWALGQAWGNETTWMFHARNAMVLTAAVLTLERCRKQLSADAKKIEEFFQTEDFFQNIENDLFITPTISNQSTVSDHSSDRTTTQFLQNASNHPPSLLTEQQNQAQQNSVVDHHVMGFA